MEEREKIEKIYKKNNVKISEDYIDNIMKDEKKSQRLYENV